MSAYGALSIHLLGTPWACSYNMEHGNLQIWEYAGESREGGYSVYAPFKQIGTEGLRIRLS